MPCPSGIPFQQELAHAAAGDSFSMQSHFRIDENIKSKFLAEFSQLFAVAFGAMSKMEISSFVHLSCLQTLRHDRLRKISGRDRGESLIERQHQHRVNPGALEQ